MSSLFAKLNKPKLGTNIGVSLSADGVAVCVTEPSANGIKVTHCASKRGDQGHVQLLKELIHEHSIPSGQANIALSIEDVKIHKLAKPSVEPSEMSQSILWLLKDRLKHGLEQSIIEAINYPEGCQLDDQIMAVETSQEKVQAIVDTMDELDIPINAIDISELVLGDILQFYEGIEKGIALVLDHQDGATLLVYRGEHLYLIRKLSGITDFIACLPSDSNMMMADMLLLEIQRTLDYYDSQMRQPPLAGILLAPSFADISPLAEYLDKNLATKVECLDLNQLMDLPQPLSPAQQHDCLTACAAVFRGRAE